jgi:ankyrin repeat protein
MPGKSKKSKGPLDDDFDEIIAQAGKMNASINASGSSTTVTNSANIVKSSSNRSSSSSSSSSSTSNQQPSEKEIILLCAQGDLAQLKLCIKRGAQVLSGVPLCTAAANGNRNIVRYLIDVHGADINEAVNTGITPLFVAAQNGQLALVRYIVHELGADVNKAEDDGATPLYTAVQEGHLAVAVCLVKELGADVNKAMNDGSTPLHIATKTNNLALIRCLVGDFGADVNRATNGGVTPLYVAVQNDRLDVLKCLVNELGADVNKAGLGITPLMAASKFQHNEVVRWLLKKGANAQTKYKDFGETAAGISKCFGAPAEQTAYIEARMHCANPGCSGAGLKKCANCLEVFFCSKECQVAAWPAHKADCKRRIAAKVGKGK